MDATPGLYPGKKGKITDAVDFTNCGQRLYRVTTCDRQGHQQADTLLPGCKPGQAWEINSSGNGAVPYSSGDADETVNGGVVPNPRVLLPCLL